MLISHSSDSDPEIILNQYLLSTLFNIMCDVKHDVFIAKGRTLPLQKNDAV